MSRLGTDGDKDSEIIPNTNINFKQKHKIDRVFNSSHRERACITTTIAATFKPTLLATILGFVWRKRNDKV